MFLRACSKIQGAPRVRGEGEEAETGLGKADPIRKHPHGDKAQE